MVTLAPAVCDRSPVGPAYAWSGFAIMWMFWVSFVLFLAAPRLVLSFWPLPTIDHAPSFRHPLVAATMYVVIAVRYEERDLATTFGSSYQRWRATEV